MKDDFAGSYCLINPSKAPHPTPLTYPALPNFNLNTANKHDFDRILAEITALVKPV